jgi:prepilin-type N-terminal cleavage/methylation domain-containing protein
MRRRLAGGAESEAGFTLIELIVVVAVLPMVVGGIAVGLVSVLGLLGQETTHLSDSNDALIGSAYFSRDIQSAAQITTQASPIACGATTQANPETQVLGLAWSPNSASQIVGGFQTVVSYVSEQVTNPQTNAVTYTLLRQQCSGGQSATPSSTQTLSKNLGTSPALVINGSGTAANQFSDITSCFSTWANVQNPTGCAQNPTSVTKVTLTITEPENQAGTNTYSYSLVGDSTNSSASPTVTTTTVPSSYGCNFAAPGSGAYATQLCFADFTGFNNTTYSATDKSCNGFPGQSMTGAIPGTSYTLSFCVSDAKNQYSSGSTPYQGNTAFAIPTYYQQQYFSEAFLGNNGFYTGIGGLPALYQYQPTTTPATMSTIYITDFQVLNAAGQPATGWTLVTGDAESTDTNEWMVYQNNSGVNWSVLDNNGLSDPYGNSCYDTNDPSNVGFMQYTANAKYPLAAGTAIPTQDKSTLPASGATFPKTGTTSVLCEASQQLNKTGTLMLSAAVPSNANSMSITVTMNGTGFGEAMFLGVLL